MVKPGRKFSFSDTCPQFFKVYLPAQSTNQLKIPPAFVEKFNGVIPSKSTVINQGMGSWSVELNLVDNELYFQNGWHKFVQDNSLEIGDFLVFCFDGSSMFHVKIFGKTACLKEVPIPSRKSTKKESTVLPKKLTFKASILEDSRKRIAMEENDGAPKAATEFVSTHPSFQVVIKPSYTDINGCYLHIPVSFINKYMGKGKENAILQVSANKWPVKVKTYLNRIARFSSGWKGFTKDNTLEAGDVCVFELIKRDDFVLKVSILRG
ncbi:putative B3 domain-containing protein Os03g0621600 [Cornus florida]|uniref:putative B3 domain-containing protein Os03g0621600 n=1 Tax=Cornus florida TaxID=4283 RepID=UPI00289D774C|nr:putative B3 domain-containing protein Os03g0621600 [Cornus florida]